MAIQPQVGKRPCDKCGGMMDRKSTLNMSGTKFEVYKCPKCNNEKKVAVGMAN